MGKTKDTNKEETTDTTAPTAEVVVAKTSGKAPKKKIVAGTLHVEATFNNTKVVLSDKDGNTLFWTSAGSLGFRGAKKGTPFAASKAGSIIGEKAKALGIKEVDVIVKGVGSGREPTIRAFMAYDIDISAIRDMTPVPHNGPKPKKPRRV
ncbi:MAG: 30S ribosomal protein S11 [Candidatus Pacebacteria bacterium]|jgi:small subunit ribosomal protein S11|nr:30S ribosomal protein S11 [Candidatus Paceibacterota bacterium]